MSEVLCEHLIFGMILFTFSVIFLQIINFQKMVVSKLHSSHKMNQFCAPNRQKAIKRLVLVS